MRFEVRGAVAIRRPDVNEHTEGASANMTDTLTIGFVLFMIILLAEIVGGISALAAIDDASPT